MINQIMLALTGVVAIYLTQQSNDNLKRYACLLAWQGNPFGTMPPIALSSGAYWFCARFIRTPGA